MGDWQRAEDRGQTANYCWFPLSFDGGGYLAGVDRSGRGFNPRPAQGAGVQSPTGAVSLARNENSAMTVGAMGGDDGGANRLAKRAASTAGIYYHKRAGLLSAVSLQGLNGNAVPI